MADNLLFLTGKLAEKSLKKVLDEVQNNPKTPPFKYRIQQIGVSVLRVDSRRRGMLIRLFCPVFAKVI